MARKSTVATLYAVAASKFDLTGTPYDLITRLSAEKPVCKCCTYWPGPARHYSVAVMTRVAACINPHRAPPAADLGPEDSTFGA
jgi:hypothetical protein